jgi:hypothetical protein
MLADQLVVPLAVPDCPVLVDQVTDVTPTLSLAVPLNSIVDDVVDTEVAPGVPMVNVGGVVSVPDPPPLVGGGVTAPRVTVTTFETLLEVVAAVRVMVFNPGASAIFGMVHAAAVPNAPPDTAIEDETIDHVTVIVPDPPAAEPDKVTADAVVAVATGLTVSVIGPVAGAGVGVGVGVGAGVPAPVCDAYMV